MDFQTIILCSLFVFLAFVVRGLTGFGSGPVMVPLMLLLLDIKLVVPTAAVHAVLTGFLLFFTFQTRKYVRKDVLFLLFPGGILGLMIGTYVLASFDSKLLKIVFGLSIMGLSLKILFEREELKKEVKNYVGLVAGLIGGIAGGIFSTGGPPVIIYLNRKIKEKEVIRATLVFYFLLHDVWRMIFYGYAGLISVHPETLIY